MNQTNYLKLFSILAFVAFAAVSCWATAESLHLLLSDFPIVMCWIVTVDFFVIASIGTKLLTRLGIGILLKAILNNANIKEFDIEIIKI